MVLAAALAHDSTLKLTASTSLPWPDLSASVHGPLSLETASQVEASGLRPVVLRGEVRLRAHLRPPRRPPRRGAPDSVALGQRVPAGAAPPALGTPLGRQQRQGPSTNHSL